MNISPFKSADFANPYASIKAKKNPQMAWCRVNTETITQCNLF